MTQTRFAILGCGRIGQVHARAVENVDTARLIAVADPVPEAARTAAARQQADIRTIPQILASDDVDAVVICTPTDTHADLIEQAARAGKAIFCEKPVDLSIARVRACLKVVEETGATLMIGFQRRFDPDIRAVKDAIEAGKIGDVEMVTLTSRDPGPPPISYIERSGGIFRDMTIHDFDVARWLLGEEVETVMAAASVLTDSAIADAGDFDSINVILRTATGKQATVTGSRRATYGYDQRIEVHGSAGSVSMQNQHESRIEIASGDGYTRPPLKNFFITRYRAAYQAELVYFARALAEGFAPAATGYDGLMALGIAEAAVRSVATGRAITVAEALA